MYIFQHMSYVPKPYFWSRIGSPWLGLGSNSARMDPAAYRNLFKPLPALREPIFGPKISKYLSVRHDPSRRPVRVRRDPAASPRKCWTLRKSTPWHSGGAAAQCAVE